MKIGVVSDTHGKFDPALAKLFQGVDFIIHGGDVCGEEVLSELSRIAPVRAISGNCDQGLPTARLPEVLIETVDSLRVLVVHDLKSSQKQITAARPDIVISGHSHFGKIHSADGVLYLNPGSSGKKRFKLLRSAAVLTVTPREIDVRLHSLESPDLPEVKCLRLPR